MYHFSTYKSSVGFVYLRPNLWELIQHARCIRYDSREIRPPYGREGSCRPAYL